VNDVPGLAAFIATAQQHINDVADATVIHTISGANVHPHFTDAIAYRRDIAKIPFRGAGQTSQDLSSRPSVSQ
jgi:hypothetical protein